MFGQELGYCELLSVSGSEGGRAGGGHGGSFGPWFTGSTGRAETGEEEGCAWV